MQWGWCPLRSAWWLWYSITEGAQWLVAVLLSGVALLVLFNCSVMSNSLQPHGLQHTRLPYSLPSPRACSNSCLLSQWCIQPSCPLLVCSLFPAPGGKLIGTINRKEFVLPSSCLSVSHQSLFTDRNETGVHLGREYWNYSAKKQSMDRLFDMKKQ